MKPYKNSAAASGPVRHPLEIFDTEALQLMDGAVSAAIETMRLTGVETDNAGRLAMARSVMAAAVRGDATALTLTEAALSERLGRRLPVAHRSSS